MTDTTETPLAETTDISDLMSHALTLWTNLTGLDPLKTRYTYQEWSILRISEEIQEALTLDPSGLTAFLLIDYFSQTYFDTRGFTVNEILADYQSMVNYMAKADDLRRLLKSPAVIGMAAAFEQNVIRGLAQYDAARDAVVAMVQNHADLGFLRRDTLRAINQLQVYQFAQGEPDPAPPVLHKQIYVFWSVPALVEMATRMPSGVALALIQDPQNYHSFFCFLIRNGGTISIMTDRPLEAHPMARQMSRRPEKQFAQRAFRFHFPYSLMGMKFTEKGDIYFARGGGTGVVPYQKDFTVAKFIRDCEPNEVIWLSMMLDRIADQFYRKDFKTPELSYTGTEITDRGRLLEVAKAANLPVVQYRETTLRRLTADDVKTTETIAATAGLRDKPLGNNRWMEDRYGPAVMNEDILNLTKGPRADTLMISAKSDEVQTKPPGAWYDRLPDNHYELQAFDLTGFGSEERLREDQVFTARYNYATLIQRAADAECNARYTEVWAWYEDRVRANLPKLLEYVGRGTLVSQSMVDLIRILQGEEPDPTNPEGPLHVNSRNILRVIDAKSDYHERDYSGVTLHGGRKNSNYLCCVNQTASSWLAIFRPQTAAGLAQMAGCTVADLPDVLQHWTKHTLSVGNHILNRLDPMDWHLQNPWCRKFGGDVGVYLSKRALAMFRKEQGHTEPAEA